jgi:predicted dehydrogenase
MTMLAESAPQSPTAMENRLPRVGFLGVGWIGQHRMRALLDEHACEAIAVADPCAEARSSAQQLAPGARAVATLEELLDFELDGAVIATPSAMHAQQAQVLLERGISVFCQKPLARTARETADVVAAARAADRLLACDLSYRYTKGMRRIRRCVLEGELGKIFAADLVFHNAYGPDKPWFRDPALSGGGCMIDLGTHLVDLALWTLGFPRVERVTSRLYAQGRPLATGLAEVEDFAVAQLDLAGGAVVRLACSWNLAAGRDAVIEARFYGSRGGAALRNVNGSFYDFIAERYEGTRCMGLAEPPDQWGGRAILAWARQLAAGAGYRPEIESVLQVATTLDATYGC